VKFVTIENLIGDAESEILEWKSSLSQLNRIIETISAFSNTKGGTIIIGVDGTGKILGISIGKDTIEQLTNKIISNTEPKIYPDISVRKFKEKDLIVIKVDKYPYDIVLAFGRPYKRVGKSTIKMSKDEYKRNILDTHKRELYFDGQICPEATIKDIDENKIKKFIDKARRERKLHLHDLLSVKEILIRLKLMKNETLTNAAILLFARNPQDFFIQSGIKAIRFKGTDVTGEMLDFKDVESDLISEVEGIENFIYQNISLKAWIEDGKIERQEKWEYPPKVIRETLVNAIIHRDYRSTAKVQIRIFDDRIEFWNPGRLPEGWTINTLKQQHFSEPFNPLLARMFFWIRYIEEIGTGTNKIIEWSKEWGLPEPEFKISGSSLFVTLRKSMLTEEYLIKLGLGERENRIVKLLLKQEKITSGEIQEIYSVTRDTANRYLRRLINLNIIERKGRGRFVYYVLREK
jgi:ATP-dependent DNA helicase RecG